MYPTENNNNQQQISDAISKGKSGIIALPATPSVDAVAAATAMYLALSKLGKNVSIVCANVPESDLVGADKIQPNLATTGDNLVISFPYTEGSIDKVDYSIQGNYFNLIISPRPGQPKIESNKVQYNYTGGVIDFVVTIDAPNLNSLGSIYAENQKEFQNKTIVNIDRHLVNDFYGTVNFVNKTSSSTSELVLKVLEQLNVEMDRDIATNLYAGLMAATNNFTSYSVNANTFEVAATLLKAGALKKPGVKPNGMGMPGMPPPPMPGFAKRPGAPGPAPMPRPPVNNPFRPPAPKPMGASPLNQPAPKPAPVNMQAPPAADLDEDFDDDDSDDTQTPQDWLKPKIFRGGGGLV